MRPRLVVLVPARNAAGELPGWLASVSRFADAVVALDDGSTDETAAILEAHPLVEVLLRNPRRETYAGWDDSANRNRLLAAAGELSPDWVLSLDADERLAADDAAALRSFVDTDALPGLAYGMRCYRMIDDLDHYDRDALWVYRLFAYEPGQSFPTARLHFVPIPTSIPRDLWVDTTIRIQHLASLTGERRAARLDKYRQADPDHEFQGSYVHLVDDPDDVQLFPRRRADLPVLAAAPTRTPTPFDPESPALSAIVISKDDEDRIEATVRSVVEQRCDDVFETIVVTSGTDRTAAIVRERFPEVRVVELDHPALPGEARNAGLRVARGDYVSFPGSHVELPQGSLAARVAAHDQGWTMVTGTTRNGTDTPAGWAAYFLDHSSVLPDRPSGQLHNPPAHCSYEARPLLELGGFPDDVRAGEDTRVNDALFRTGCTAYRDARLELVHRNRSRTIGHLLRHHFERGRAQVQLIREIGGPGAGDRRARGFLRGYPKRRLARIDRSVEAWGGGLRPRYRKVRPLVRLGVVSAWAGGRVELRRPSLVRAATTTGVVDPLTRPLRLAPDRPAPHSGARVLFVHIPKTGGSTLSRIVEREYAERPIARVYGDTDAALGRLEAMVPDERGALCAVVGHMGVGLDAILPGSNVYVTLLRDPVDRIVSHYHYALAHADEGDNARALQGVSCLEDYVCSSAFAELVNNGQTRLLGATSPAADVPADDAALERALALVERDDVIVGLQDRFDESLLLLVLGFGWGFPAYRPENVGRSRPAVDELAESTVTLIRERNELDLVLYDHARRRFEREVAAVDDLEGRLELLRLAGRWWSRPGGDGQRPTRR